MTASAGLTYQAVTSTAGSTCNPCMAGSNQWRLTLPTIPAAATTLITLTGQLASNLTTLPVVTRTLRSSAGAIPLSGAAVTHLTDSVPPSVTVLYASPAVLHPGANAVYGQADDGTVIGVAKVEIRLGGATQGSQGWKFRVAAVNQRQRASAVSRAPQTWRAIWPLGRGRPQQSTQLRL